ncbi:DUF916 domain-containing protein [Dactylosporangium sp. AC04546]|uniref:WxL protein peptidoglycan domain-containing protein n=1 Tax=Dactylosporangium sp. AC04546 TaxID=2862460 RepID=UPI001EDF0FB6|nr:DUF916 domain-containing protein [Dactylosporangium sp. AC04546]WVK81489.1 DUF916 domain-containing protein [Dactylosporangium sp. AC04546]
MRAKLAAAAAALAIALTPGVAHAADNGEWSVSPTPPASPGPAPRQYFFLESAPGTSVQDSVRVANLADQPRVFRMYGADAYNTPRDGGFGLRTQDQQQTDIGAWTQVGAVTVNVPARTQVDIPFVITVPANASPGDHVGGIVAMEEQPGATTKQGGVDVTVRRAVAARVYLRVSGPAVPGLSVTGVRLSHATPWLPSTVDGGWACVVTNTGNLHLPPKITVTVTGLFGHAVRQRTAVPQVDLLPGARTELSGTVDGVWPFDIVTTRVTAVADGGVTSSATDRTFVVSWPVAGLLIAGVIVLIWYRRRRAKAVKAVPRRRLSEPVAAG